jgi:hypothetical protein
VAKDSQQRPAAVAGPWQLPVALALIFIAVAIFTVGLDWDPVGQRQEGRVLVVEKHSDWSWTDKPYDTDPASFGHDFSYNYRAIYEYLNQYFEMARLSDDEEIDASTLENYDVLVIKIATERYSQQEVEAVLQFVDQGGGLLLIGEHTNFEKSSAYMNDLTRHLGFTLRHDLLYGLESSYEQHYRPPRVPHPAVQHMPPMDFAVGCSIDPGRSFGRAVIRETGLFGLPAYYRPDNYMPNPQHRSDMRYGAFIQLWATRYGDGRVLAFTDSTIFSNFCVFQPGKAELMLGMVEWLNHRGGGNPRPWLLLLSLVPLAVGLWRLPVRGDAWLLALAAGCCGWAVASGGVAAVHRTAMPPPERVRPGTEVVIDRGLSQVKLSEGAYTTGEGEGYGLLEQWIARPGYFPVRRRGLDVFSGDVLVVLCPSRSVSESYRERLLEFVAAGGKLLVIDSPENTASTANSLLQPFGLSVLQDRAWQGSLSLGEGRIPLRIEAAREVTGGEPVGRMDKTPVAALAQYGKGAVMAIGFGSRFNDTSLGGSWDAEFTADNRARCDVLFALLRLLVEGAPIPPGEPAEVPEPDEILGGESD